MAKRRAATPDWWVNVWCKKRAAKLAVLTAASTSRMAVRKVRQHFKKGVPFWGRKYPVEEIEVTGRVDNLKRPEMIYGLGMYRVL